LMGSEGDPPDTRIVS